MKTIGENSNKSSGRRHLSFPRRRCGSSALLCVCLLLGSAAGCHGDGSGINGTKGTLVQARPPSLLWRNYVLPSHQGHIHKLAARDSSVVILGIEPAPADVGMGDIRCATEIDLANGVETWTSVFIGPPVRELEVEGDSIFLAGDDAVVVINARTDQHEVLSTEDWSTKIPVWLELDANHLYVSLSNGEVLAIARNEPRVAWRYQMQRGSKALLGCDAGIVLCASDVSGEVTALNAQDGAILWQRELPELDDPRYPDATYVAGGSPTIAADVVVLPMWGGFSDSPPKVMGLALNDGSTRFINELPTVCSTLEPATDGEWVYLGCMNGQIMCFGLPRGERRWSVTPAETPSTILAIAISGQTVFAADSEGRLFGIVAESGEPLWEIQLGVKLNPQSRLVVSDRYLVVTAGPEMFVFVK